jgi:hypothetical protein
MADAVLLVEIKTQIAGLKAGLTEAENLVKSNTGSFQNLGKASTGALKSAEKSSQELRKGIEAASHEVTALGGTFGQMARASRGIGGIFTASGAAEISAGIAGVGIALLGLASHTAGEVIELQHLSTTTGVSVEALGAMKAGLERAGVSGDLLRRGLPRLEEKIFTAAEQSKEARDAFAILGLQTEKWSKQLPDLVTVLSTVNKGLSTHRLNAAQAAAVSEVFGLRTQELAAALPAMMNALKDPATLEFGRRMQDAVGAAEEFKKEEAILSEEITEVGVPVLQMLIKAWEYLKAGVRETGMVIQGFGATFLISMKASVNAIDDLAHGRFRDAIKTMEQSTKDMAEVAHEMWANMQKDADDTAAHIAGVMAGRGPGGPPTRQVLPVGFGEGKGKKDTAEKKYREQVLRDMVKQSERIAAEMKKAQAQLQPAAGGGPGPLVAKGAGGMVEAEKAQWKEINLIVKQGLDQEEKLREKSVQDAKRTEQQKEEAVRSAAERTTAEIQQAESTRYGFRNLFAEKANALIQKGVGMAISWAYKKLVAQIAADKLSQASSAGKGAAKAGSDLPFPVNLIAAATTFSSLMAYEKGGIIPATSLSMVHKNEMILPRHISEFVQRSAARGAGEGGGAGLNVNFHQTIHAMDSSGVSDVLNKNSSIVFSVLQRELRKRNL